MDLLNLEKLQFGEDTNKRLTCKDGFWLSVQGDRDKYSKPREKCYNAYAYDSMEIMASELLPPNFKKYLDNEKNRIYGYVPVEMIESLLASHGGVCWEFQSLYAFGDDEAEPCTQTDFLAYLAIKIAIAIAMN